MLPDSLKIAESSLMQEYQDQYLTGIDLNG